MTASPSFPGRFGRMGRLAGARRTATLASVALLALFSAAGASVFPFLTGLPDVTGVYRLPQPVAGVAPGNRMPVYDLQPDGRATRSGQANVAPDGAIRMSRFDDREPGGAWHPVLLPASVRTLWVLATEAERAELRASAEAFIRAAGHALEGAATSPVFEAEYRPVLSGILSDTATAAWRTPPVQDALAELLRVVDPMLRRVAADDLRPALMERLQPALWQAVRSNAANLLDVFSTDFRLDFRPFEAAVGAAIADPRVRRGIADTLAAAAGTPQMRTLAERLATAFLHALRDDPRLADTLNRMMQDGRLSAYLAPLGEPVLALVRAIPRTLARLDEQAELNSLAADIFKTQARGWSGHVVVYMPPGDRDRVAAIDPMVPVTLEPEGTR